MGKLHTSRFIAAIRRCAVAIVFGALALAGAAPAGAEPSGPPIRVGGSMALTGPLASTGLVHKLAGEIFLQQINKGDGLLGRPVEWVVLDEDPMLSTFYYDSSSVSRDKEGMVSVWTRAIYSEEGKADALDTMGLDPVVVLILPRILALVCALPILTFIGSMAALYGGGLVAWFYGGMEPASFIARLHDAVSVTHFKVGMIKAPFMALVIGIVACSEGLRVKGSAESLGKQTTTSVVKSIFLVIVLDGLFAVFFASIGM